MRTRSMKILPSGCSTSFLDLPDNVRLKVYTFAGLVRYCPIDLATPQRQGIRPYQEDFPDREETGYWPDCWMLSSNGKPRTNGLDNWLEFSLTCFCQELPTALLYVSRAFYNDVLGFLVGHNKFILRAGSIRDLMLLKTMGNKSLALMNSLLIRLNRWPFLTGQNCGHWDTFNLCGPPPSDPPLKISTKKGRDILKNWETICQRISAVVPDGQLRLTFICDTIDRQSAQQVCQTIMSLPTLQSCTIRLGRLLNSESPAEDQKIKNLIENICIMKTHQRLPRKEPFPFFRLPQELREHILSFTHLSSPGSYDRKYNDIRIADGRLHGCKEESFHDDDEKICCWKCTDTFADCCCPRLRVSYSATCQCRLLYIDLGILSVSKQMRAEALRVFYSRNAFEFQGVDRTALTLMQKWPKETLRLIRLVRFTLKMQCFRTWNEDDFATSFSKLILFMKQNFNIKKLSIEINTLPAHRRCLYEVMEEVEMKNLFKIHVDMINALKPIGDEVAELRFKLGWFIEMDYLMEKEILGERWTVNPWPRESIVRHFNKEYRIPFVERVYAVPKWWWERAGIVDEREEQIYDEDEDPAMFLI